MRGHPDHSSKDASPTGKTAPSLAPAAPPRDLAALTDLALAKKILGIPGSPDDVLVLVEAAKRLRLR